MQRQLVDLIEKNDLQPPLAEEQALTAAQLLGELTDMQVYQDSLAAAHQALFFLGRRDKQKFLGIVSSSQPTLKKFDGSVNPISLAGRELTLKTCETSPANMTGLRQCLPYLTPHLLGLGKSIGCGDRLGLATPGHVRAVRNGTMAPIYAQQSVRENARTGRTPQQVMDDAAWGVFEAGWRSGFGADADHLKTLADIEAFVNAGYTFFTIDPGDHVNPNADVAGDSQLAAMLDEVAWGDLETDSQDLLRRLADKPVDLGDFSLTMTRSDLARAAAKYGNAVAHVARMYRRLVQLASRPFELEVSVDETATPTRVEEHIYIASELKRLGVKWVSLAPRYPGEFEKGIDYRGDLDVFRDRFRQHCAVAQAFGPYKLSLHSGSDKFSIYPIAAAEAGELVHLKTAGTSYLEALRTMATLEPQLFRDVLSFSMRHYEASRATYHVSASLSRVPDPESVPTDGLPFLFNEEDARQVLHVTFGDVLNDERQRDALYATLAEGEELHYEYLARHFTRHVLPFGDEGN